MDATERNPAIAVLGSGGGVARALLAVLNEAAGDPHDPLYGMLSQAALHLVDVKEQAREEVARRLPRLAPGIVLHQFDLRDTERFRAFLEENGIRLAVDVSWGDTIELVQCCDELGVLYVNSALENPAVDEDESLFGFPTTERFDRFEAVRESLTNTKAIVCSGMNPGVVQWMALRLMRERPDELPLACYIVEHDSSFYADDSRTLPSTLYTTWSGECFLDEAIGSYPMFVRNRMPCYWYEDVYALEFKVRLGKKTFAGCLMPHEEVLTLGERFDMETGFIYRVNETTTAAIRSNLDDPDRLWTWDHVIIDGTDGEVSGEDLVGVLLVYPNDEVYMYNAMRTSDIYPVFGCNATYYQVACGLYAGIASLLLDDLPNGVRYVDELLLATGSRYESYLRYYMREFTIGSNRGSDGLLHERMKRLPPG